MAVSTIILFGAGACGGDGGGVEPNTDPVANFTVAACTAGTPCQFTDASTDADGSIASRAWDFGDPASGANTSDEVNPVHAFSAAGTYNVRLTVTDNGGKTNSKTSPVTVTGTGTGNTPPTANFDLPTGCTAGTPCGFHSTSDDSDGVIASWVWEFGDGETAEGPDATHTFDAAGTFNVELTVTDDEGASTSITQALTVAPAASEDCTTSALPSGTRIVNCNLTMTQRVTVSFRVESRSCELAANQLRVMAPRDQYVFFNLCTRPVGAVYPGATDTPLVVEAGAQLAFRFEQGSANPGNPPTGDPGIQISGAFPNWTLNIDDGGAPTAEGEPDFDDAVISVTATPAP
jgi:PKD repeat protein